MRGTSTDIFTQAAPKFFPTPGNRKWPLLPVVWCAMKTKKNPPCICHIQHNQHTGQSFGPMERAVLADSTDAEKVAMQYNGIVQAKCQNKSG